MKLFNLSFLALHPSDARFLEYRHMIDSTVFTGMADQFDITHLKVIQPGYQPGRKSDNEVYFNGRTGFFRIPISLFIYIFKKRPNVIMLHGFVFPFQLLWLYFFIPAGTKIIVQHHAEKPFKNGIKRWFQKIAYSRAHAFLFVSNEQADLYLKHGIIKDKTKIHEVMEGSSLFGVNDKSNSRRLLNIDGARIFLWVGRLDSNKDPLTVVKAFHKYKASGRSYKFYYIYGTNELETELQMYIQQHDLSDEVILVGKVPHENMEVWYNAADYFVAASYYEGSGIALSEAMACGCIPVVSRIDSFVKMTDHGSCGLLFQPGNVIDLFNVLCSLDLIDINEWSTQVANHYQQELSMNAIGKRIKQIAISLVKQ